MKKRTGECTEEIFWECVEEINWPVADFRLVEGELLHAWTPQFGAGFEKILEEKRSLIYKAVEGFKTRLSDDERSQYYLSDDGMSDFSAHVPGLGRKIFEEEVADYRKLYKRACASDYKENFGYCIPSPPLMEGSSFEEWCEKAMGCRPESLVEETWEPDYFDPSETFEEHIGRLRENWQGSTKGDWRNIEPDHYAKRWEFYLQHFAAFLAELEYPTTESEKAAQVFAAKIVRYINCIILERTQEALDLSEETLAAWWGLYHVLDIGDLRRTHSALLSRPYHHECGGENLINDHRRYMGGLPGFTCRFHLKQLREQAKQSA